jgi:hypothetical protein
MIKTTVFLRQGLQKYNYCSVLTMGAKSIVEKPEKISKSGKVT